MVGLGGGGSSGVGDRAAVVEGAVVEVEASCIPGGYPPLSMGPA